MTENVFKTMGRCGGGNIAMGIITIISGVSVGVCLIVSGASLLKNRADLTF